jgi:CBS domain-containing protein
MQLKDVMTADVQVANGDATLQEAAKLMKSLDVGVLPVGDGEKLIGMLTDRDITVRATAEGYDPKKTKVKEVMTADMIYCFEDQALVEAAVLMQEQQIRRLPILSRDMQLVGIVSLADLAVDSDEAAMDDDLLGEVLEGISEPGKSNQ